MPPWTKTGILKIFITDFFQADVYSWETDNSVTLVKSLRFLPDSTYYGWLCKFYIGTSESWHKQWQKFHGGFLRKKKTETNESWITPNCGEAWEIKTIDISLLQHSLWPYSFQSVLLSVSSFLFLLLLILLLSSIPILHLKLSTTVTPFFAINFQS